MVKTKTTKLVKGSASPKELNMQLQRVQNKAGSLKPAKIRREQSAHWSKKLNEWTSKDKRSNLEHHVKQAATLAITTV